MRTHRGIPPTMSSSRAHSSGRSPRPIPRAAVAGNMACRSSVAVKTMLTMSSWATPLRSSISRSRAWTRASISSAVSLSSVVAPRKARTAGDTQPNLLLPFCRSPILGRQGEAHDGASVVARLGPDASAVSFDHLLADGETDARTGPAFGAAPSVEHGEDRAGLVGHHAGTVVGHREQPMVVAPLGADVDLERSLGAPVLHRVADEVLEQTR